MGQFFWTSTVNIFWIGLYTQIYEYNDITVYKLHAKTQLVRVILGCNS